MEVRVVRTLRRFIDQIDIVQLPQGFQIAVPCWMLDPVVCSQLPQAAKPRVALHALRRLAEIVRQRRLLIGATASLSDPSPPTKGDHVSREEPTLSSTPTAPLHENALGPAPRTDTHSVSSTDEPTAASGGWGCPQGKERS
jgi:hypothetical protein